ncbi:hypothetical protein [Pseudoduganella sp. GCM10020061]|uniref:hypothetical protein n=1 Tax=Pseudoduganella sp. GCM10020061 TaxID=3317345 RepID=UPI003638FEB8
MNPNIHSTLRQLGLADACWYALARGVARISRGHWSLYKYRFVAQPVTTRPLCGNRGRSVDVRTEGPGIDPQQFRRRAEVLSQRFAQGAQCLAAYVAGRLAGYLWYCVGPYREDEVRASFVPGSADAAWDFDVQVFSEHQLGFAFARLWDEANRRLHAAGIRWSISRISAFNPGSRAAHARLGAVEIGSAVFLRCGGWQWMAATLAPFVHCSRNDQSVPQLRLAPPASGAQA